MVDQALQQKVRTVAPCVFSTESMDSSHSWVSVWVEILQFGKFRHGGSQYAAVPQARARTDAVLGCAIGLRVNSR